MFKVDRSTSFTTAVKHIQAKIVYTVKTLGLTILLFAHQESTHARSVMQILLTHAHRHHHDALEARVADADVTTRNVPTNSIGTGTRRNATLVNVYRKDIDIYGLLSWIIANVTTHAFVHTK